MAHEPRQRTASEHEPGSGQGTTPAPSPFPSLSLPKGGGAIRGIGEKSSVAPATGTSTLTVPVATSAGRDGLGPQLNLNYDSGSGNGPFGVGWTLGVPAITRATDKRLPRYQDGEESDEFVLSGSETLVRQLDAGNDRFSREVTLHGVDYAVVGYRPRTEGLFARIERWSARATGIGFWRTISRDNVTSLYGLDRNERVFDQSDELRTFSWLLSRTYDDKGNLAIYRYVAENDDRVNTGAVHEANRDRAGIPAQRYLKRVLYAADTPWFPNWNESGDQTALPGTWRHEIVLDYGDHQTDAPTPAADQRWAVRPDPFSSYRSGFELRTYRRCERFLLFHHFEGEPAVGNDCLVRSTDLTYSDEVAPADPRNPIYTLLTAVEQAGYRRQGGGYLRKAAPSLEFDYSVAAVRPDVFSLDSESAEGLPEGIDGTRAQLVDLDGDGLTGVLSRSDGGWTYKPNLSPLNRARQSDGTYETLAAFGSPATVASLPALGRSPGLGQLMDLAGDGRLDLVTWEDPVPGFHERNLDGSWEPFAPIPRVPSVDWNDPNLKFVDLSGDGHADLLVTLGDALEIHESLGEEGFAASIRVPLPADERAGPRIVFADGTKTIHLADMTGDGMSDLVRVRNGEVCYWPNLGFGRFGARVTMGAAPRFADETRYDPDRVRLADIDGSGTTDVLYVGHDGVWLCFNHSGNDFAEPQRLAVFPNADAGSSVLVTDLLGNGTACLVWSSSAPDMRAAPLRYVDLMGSEKPHLMVRSRNNLGGETRVRYAPSTRFALEDARAGRPWVTRLPFPVHVVERVETYDWIGRTRSVNRYAYHHGYFDEHEREFRGFGMVEQWDTEELRGDTDFAEAEFTNWEAASWSPPVLTKTWFHTGAFDGAAGIARRFAAEYWVEPALRSPAKAVERAAMELADTVMPPGLPPDEVRDAYRALRGSTLRTEVFALDGSALEPHPYSVTEQNLTVERVQLQGPNPHPVFVAHPRETISYSYERAPGDPRVTHDVTLEVDEYGDVLRAFAIGYPRRPPGVSPEPDLSQMFQEMLAHDQRRSHVTATQHRFTNAIDDIAAFPHDHRTPLGSESIVADVTGVAPAAQLGGITNRFSFAELDAIWATAWDGAHELDYEEVLAADIDGTGAPAAAPTRRIVAHTRTRYRSDDLTALLPSDELQPLALTGESWQLALTPGLVARMFGGRVDAGLLAEGGYVQLAGHPGWWVPSGRVFLSAGDADTPAAELNEARAHFFQTRRAVDPFGAVARVAYAYDLVPVETVDPVGNVTTAEIDYRVLLPFRATEPNGNRVEAAFDALGLVVANAARGKSTEQLGDELSGFTADLEAGALQAIVTDPLADPGGTIGDASARMVYDLFAYHRTRDQPQPAPPVVYTISRERHVNGSDPAQAAGFQHTFAYSDGFGREIQKKARAEAGPVAEGGPEVSPRWAVSGWTIFDNKGRAVRTYEPFFSSTQMFEFARVEGVATTHLFDPLGRELATLQPNATWTKTVFDSWRQERWDGNDTADVADPRTDADVGPLFRRLLGDAPDAYTSWRKVRIDETVGDTPAQRAAEHDAADKALAHAGTPVITHLDARGRTCLEVSVNTGNERFPSRTALDAESKPLAVIDALGRRVLEHCLREELPAGGFRYVAGFDLVGNPLYRNGMDDSERRTLVNVLGLPIRAWDGKGRVSRMRYDAMQRPTHRYVDSGAGEVLAERSIYGEAFPDRNLRGRLWRTYDGAGLASSERYDFKGNLAESARQVARQHRGALDWAALDALVGLADLDAAAGPLLVAEDRFVSSTSYDALSRAIQVITPHNAAMRLSVLRPGYNEAGLPERLDVWVRRPQAPAGLLDPATAELHAITAIAYNARAQRMLVTLGNGSVTSYTYDPLTFRLVRLRTTRPGSFAANRRVVQDLSYAYDPVGNVTRIRDDADTQNVVFFQNQRVDPTADYTYDAVYRLVRATGREHLGQTGGLLDPPKRVDNDDLPRTRRPHPNDGNAMATYAEAYTHDAAGNLLTMVHRVSSGSWTRAYTYAEQSRIVSTEMGNRLSTTGDPGRPPDTSYTYDAHGLMLRMPHLPAMTWDEQDRLSTTTRQVVNTGTPETTHYVYAGNGERVRKVTDKAAGTAVEPQRRSERIVLGPIELHRIYNGDGTTVTIERETLHVGIGAERAALVETRTTGIDPGPTNLVRYQLGNHLGSATLELDEGAEIISYEEYFPFGSTSFQSVRSQTETPKRYRFTGKERDEESDLTYHGARYYAPWLGRWTAPDPAGLADGLNRYAYVRNAPTRLRDPSGTQGESFADLDDVVKELNESNAVQDLLTDKRAPLAPRNKPWSKKEARAYANKQAGAHRAASSMNQGATVQAGHTAAARHAPESGISEADWDKQPMQELHSRKGQGLDVEVTDNKSGTKASRTRHTAQEGMINDAVERSRASGGGKLTPQGQLDAAAEVDWRAENTPLDQRNVDAVRNGGPAAPEKGPKVNPDTGAVVKAESTAVKSEATAVKAEAKALKTEAKALKTGGEALEVAAKSGGKTILKKLGTKALKVIPFVGMGAGVASASYEASQGNTGAAALDTVGLIPVVGDLVDAARLGVAVGEAADELLGISNVAAEHGTAVEGAAKSLGFSQDTSRIIGATGAALSSITIAPSIAISRTVSGWFQ